MSYVLMTIDSQKPLYTSNYQELVAIENVETRCIGPTKGFYKTCTPVFYQNGRTSLQQQTRGKIGHLSLMLRVPQKAQAELRSKVRTVTASHDAKGIKVKLLGGASIK